MIKIIALTLILFSCKTLAPQEEIQGTGLVLLTDPVRNTYIIQTTNGKRYLPVNMDKEFRQDSLLVTFTAKADTAGLRNVRLAAIPVRLISIRRK